MSFVENTGASLTPANDTEKSASLSDVSNGAIDTLSCIIRAMGDLSFSIDGELDVDLFQGLCEQYACHVENGAAVAAHEIPMTPDGTRQWSNVRHFYIDRRTHEQTFVNERIGDYRDIVKDLVAGLKRIGQRDKDTETGIRRYLEAVENAVDVGNVDEIKSVVSDTITNVTDIFSQQKAAYETQIQELNKRMSCLRDDLNQATEKMQRDALTETFNRGAFDAAITRALNTHFILGQPVTLVLVDLDDFKAVNDNHGHAAGDEVLRQVGEALARSFIRRNDFVARFGGDEFAVILTDTTATNATVLLERFMDNIQKIIVPGEEHDRPIGCSIGYTELNDNDSVTTAIERADAGLYDAKRAGRNCYRYASNTEVAS